MTTNKNMAMIALAAVFAVTAAAGGQALPSTTLARPAPVIVLAASDRLEVRPGDDFYVAVDMRIGVGWAYYGPDPGVSPDFSPLPAGMTVRAGGLRVGEVLWPPATKHSYELFGKRLTNNVYEGRTVAYVPMTAPPDMQAGTYDITVAPRGQICGYDTCVQLERLSASVRVVVGRQSLANPAWGQDAALAEGLKSARPAAAGKPPEIVTMGDGAAERFSLWGGLGIALLAGVILNVMPCVLPVIPLKVLGIAQKAGSSYRRVLFMGLAFAGGIMLFFGAIAMVNLLFHLLRHFNVVAGGNGDWFDWGRHFQSAWFRAAVAVVLVTLAANLMGLFTVLAPRRLTNAVSRLAGGGEGYRGAMGMGLLTGVLSTPCSFALLSLALAWAQLQPPLVGAAAMLLIGVGMAAPYLLLIAFPPLVRRLPRPGRWMTLLERSMGFVLLLVAVWLIGTTAASAYPFWAAAYAVVLAFCLWMWAAWARRDAAAVRKFALRVAAVLLAAGAGFYMLGPSRQAAVRLADFDESRIAEALSAGRVVVVDFTASWCLTCKLVEARVYDQPSVAAEFAKRNVLAMKGDVTESSMPANVLRERLGEAIPVTVVFPPGDRPPIRLRGIFSKDDLFAALDQAAKPL